MKKKNSKSKKVSKAVVVRKPQETFPAITADDVRNHICPTATVNEIALFLQIAKANKLNPFKREVYMVKYGDQKAQILTGYEVYLKRAEDTKMYGGFKAWIEGEIPKMKACIDVYRKDWKQSFHHEVYYSEYVQYKKTGEINKFWKTKPITMLKKVAISQAFRLAFPKDFGGLPYTQDEMPMQIEEEKSNGKPDVEMPKAISDKVVDAEVKEVKTDTPKQKVKEEPKETPKEAPKTNQQADLEIAFKDLKPKSENGKVLPICEHCSTDVDEAVYKFSLDVYGHVLCRKCQGVFNTFKKPRGK